jgi:WhiB family redox-sensing transcriptional regulator
MSGALETLLATLAGAPSLPGARCRGRHHMFDAAVREDPTVVEQRHAQALDLCARCPWLDRCADWLESLPKRQRPLGVVAGRRYLTTGPSS